MLVIKKVIGIETKELVTWIHYLISVNRLDTFYHSKYFKAVKREVMREQHNECQRCKEHGKLTIVRQGIKRGVRIGSVTSGVVHHVQWVRTHPELALSKYYIDKFGVKHRQLIVLCDECHEIEHDRFSILPKKELLNEEKW